MANESGRTELGQNSKLTYVNSNFFPKESVKVTLSGEFSKLPKFVFDSGRGSERQHVTLFKLWMSESAAAVKLFDASLISHVWHFPSTSQYFSGPFIPHVDEASIVEPNATLTKSDMQRRGLSSSKHGSIEAGCGTSDLRLYLLYASLDATINNPQINNKWYIFASITFIFTFFLF